MDFGIGYFPTHDAVGPGEIARLVEERGHESLFFAEHTHIPASRETPYPGGGELPRKYSHTYDLFVALTAAAAATSRLRVGSGICLVIERDPIITAKEVASIDHLSGGRFEFGVGAGWNREEMANHGTDPRTRMRLLARAGRGDEGDLDRRTRPATTASSSTSTAIWSWPKPAAAAAPAGAGRRQRPDRARPRARLRRRLVSRTTRARTSLERAAELRARAERPIDVWSMGLPAEPGGDRAAAEAGCRRVVHWIPSARPAVGRAALERWEAAIAEFTGEA